MEVPQPTAFPFQMHDKYTHQTWEVTKADAVRCLTGCGGPYSTDDRMLRLLPDHLLVMDYIYHSRWRSAYQYWYEGKAYDFKDLPWASPD